MTPLEAAKQLVNIYMYGHDAKPEKEIQEIITTNTGWDATLVEESLSFVAGHSLRRQDLQNEVWLLRIFRAINLLRHASPWFGEDQRLTGDLMRSAATDPIPSHQTAQLLATLFAARHSDGEACAAAGKLRELNDGLRLRAREAMLAYLAPMRCDTFPDPGRTPAQWSAHLLCDVEKELGSSVTRVEAAISAIQRFVTAQLASDPRHTKAARWTKIGEFTAWQTEKWPELWPENVHLSRPEEMQSPAFREFLAALRDNRLATTGSEWPNTEHLPRLEKEAVARSLPPELLEADATAGKAAAGTLAAAIGVEEPHRGWLRRLGDTAKDGWQPGPIGMTGTTYLEVDTDQYLFWVVPTKTHEDNDSDPKDYTPPDQRGAISAAIHQHPAVRLGWSKKLRRDSHWETSRVTDEWVRVPDPKAVVLHAKKAGSSIHVSAGNGDGWVVPSESPEEQAGEKANASPVLFDRVTSLGGLTQLPTQYAPLAPKLADRYPPGPDGDEGDDCSKWTFGFCPRERKYDVPAQVAEALGDRGAYREAKKWLDLGLPIQNDKFNLKWDELVESKKNLTLRQLETMLDWVDSLVAGHTEERTRQAAALTQLVETWLGHRPRIVDLDDGDAPTLGCVTKPSDGDTPNDCPKTFFGKPLNPRLTDLWNQLEIRRARMNQNRDQRGAVIGPHKPGSLDFFTTPRSHGGIELRSPYRFTFLMQRALEMTGELKALGNALVGAIEKSDAEHLSLLRTAHEGHIAHLARDIRQKQWEEAETQWRVLRQNRFNTEFRKRFYEELINGGWSSGELAHLQMTQAAESKNEAAWKLEIGGQVVALIADVSSGNAGPFPVFLSRLFGGDKLAKVLQMVSSALRSQAGITQSEASRKLTEAGYHRRHREWVHQRDTARHEITWLERQIDAAHQRLRLAEMELNSQQKQWENSRRVLAFLRGKFSNAAFQDWMVRETRALYRQMFRITFELCRQTELAFRYERHFTDRTFVDDGTVNWTSAREGATAAEQLQLALRRMQQTYENENEVEHELPGHISIRKHFGTALVALRTMGVCEIEIPEWFFDRSFPGQYVRRLKSVAVSIPCSLAPYQTVNARVTLLSSKTRVSPNLDGSYAERKDGEDPRFVRSVGVVPSIVTSGAQNDSGRFELNLRDERYLPFEGAGAVSRWRIELPHETNLELDFNTVADVVLHLRFTAREAGEPLRSQALAEAERHLPSRDHWGTRLIHLRHDFPAEWSKVEGWDRTGGDCPICIDASIPGMFSWVSPDDSLKVPKIEIVVVVDQGNELPDLLTGAWKGGPGDSEVRFYRDREFDGHFRAILGPDELPKGNAIGRRRSLRLHRGWGVEPSDIFLTIHYFPKLRASKCPPRSWTHEIADADPN